MKCADVKARLPGRGETNVSRLHRLDGRWERMNERTLTTTASYYQLNSLRGASLQAVRDSGRTQASILPANCNNVSAVT